MLCMKFVATQTLPVRMYIYGETFQPLQHRLRQHSRSCYNENDSAVIKHTISSRDKVNVNDVTILDGDENWFECDVKNSAWVR